MSSTDLPKLTPFSRPRQSPALLVAASKDKYLSIHAFLPLQHGHPGCVGQSLQETFLVESEGAVGCRQRPFLGRTPHVRNC